MYPAVTRYTFINSITDDVIVVQPLQRETTSEQKLPTIFSLHFCSALKPYIQPANNFHLLTDVKSDFPLHLCQSHSASQISFLLLRLHGIVIKLLTTFYISLSYFFILNTPPTPLTLILTTYTLLCEISCTYTSIVGRVRV